MATLPTLTGSAITTITDSPFALRPFNQQRTQFSSSVHRRHSIRRRSLLYLSCKGGNADDNNAGAFTIDRCNVLVGLGGGMYGALSGAFGTGLDEKAAIASPIAPVDISKCGPSAVTSFDPANDDLMRMRCCPPYSDKIVDFKPPPPSSTRMRVRRAAQDVVRDEEYMAKFKKAIHLMKNLDPEDPRSFSQQANIHCAYCNGAYEQVGFPKLRLQVHESWLFFPFHRYYLYFFERILGNLIGDDSFAVPFWNWDSPGGMELPAIYADPLSPLYDPRRNPDHQPPHLVNLDVKSQTNPSGQPISDGEMICNNLRIMYRAMEPSSADLFLGSPCRAGDAKGASGSVERTPHGAIHVWAGDPRQRFGEDMGSFHSTARDTVFYAHHANVDRLWKEWKELDPSHKDFTDPDWLDSGFLFYDENAQLVRVKIHDCLDTAKLGYTYQQVGLPWLNFRPTPTATARQQLQRVKISEDDTGLVFPRKLDEAVKATVKRPKKARSRKEKEEEEEVLVVEFIEMRREVAAKMDVFVNVDDYTKCGPGNREFAGSLVNVVQSHSDSYKSMLLKIGISKLLEDIGAEEDDAVLVTLVPRFGEDAFTVGGVHIQLQSIFS